MKKHTSLPRLLPLALAAALLTVPAAAGFRDTSGHWAEQTLNDWQERGILSGYADGTCQPDGAMSRAGFAKLMNRALNFTEEAPISFTDVGPEDWFYAEAARAVAAGYAQGSGGMFLPQQTITRAQAAAMIARAAGLTADETKADTFTDAASLPAWAKGSIGAVAAAGLMNGYADGTFRPESLITRAQAVVTLDRVVKSLEAKAPDSEKATTPSGSGGSSSGGGSSSAVWTVTGAEAVPDVTVDYGTSEADAMGKLPGTVTLNAVKRGRTGTVSAQVSWALDRAYDPAPSANAVYTATGMVTLPSGYTYSGALTVTAKLTVKGDPDKTVVNILDVAGLELPYGAAESAARLPAQVTVETEQGNTLLADVAWTLNGEWASPGVNTYTGTVAIPAGYSYQGTDAAATITLTVTVVAEGETPQVKRIFWYVAPDIVEIDYVSTPEQVLAAVRAKLPETVMLQCLDGSYIPVTVPADAWAFRRTKYYPTPYSTNLTSLDAVAALPAGYEDADGKTTVYCDIRVKELDTAALEDALDEAKALLDRMTVFENVAFEDPAKIYVVPDSMCEDDITNGVKFIWGSQAAPLRTAYNNAEGKNPDSFTSQADCDSTAQDLRDKAAALKAAVKTGTNTNTWAYVKSLVEDALSADRNPDAPYHSVKQPLKAGSFYSLFHYTPSLPGSDMVLSSVDWSVKGDGASLVDVGLGVGSNRDAYGAQIKSAPAEPKSVTFVATAVCTHRTDPNKTFTFTFDYTATIGAPIRVDTTVAMPDPPRLTSSNIVANDISLRVPLTGAEYITGIDASKITVKGYADPSSGTSTISIPAASITEGKSCTADNRGLFVPVTAACGTMSLKPVQTDSDGTPKLDYRPGKIRVTIQREALTVKEGSGWYAPNEDLTYDAEVWVCNPAVTVTIQGASNKDTAYRNVSVQIEYAYKKFFGAVAFATENSAEGAAAAGCKVRFNDVDWKDGSGQNLITCTKENEPLALDPNTTYYIWWNFSGNEDNDPLTSPGDWMDAKITILPSSETP